MNRLAKLGSTAALAGALGVRLSRRQQQSGRHMRAAASSALAEYNPVRRAPVSIGPKRIV